MKSNLQKAASKASTLLEACEFLMEADALELPTIPDISYKIRKAINDEAASSTRIARIVQMDPAITARLVQIANSALYIGNKKIESCPEAITRLGLKATQSIVTSISLKAVFKAKHRIPEKLANKLWQHSSFVAAISAALAFKTRGFDPDRAMLAGLVHDIGTIPILTLADQNLAWAQDLDQIQETVGQLKSKMGVVVMKSWDFPQDFCEICQNAENWGRNHAEPADYIDLVIIAQMHSYIGTPLMRGLPPIDQVPAFGKLISTGSDPQMSLNILEMAREDIDQMQKMLL